MAGKNSTGVVLPGLVMQNVLPVVQLVRDRGTVPRGEGKLDILLKFAYSSSIGAGSLVSLPR